MFILIALVPGSNLGMPSPSWDRNRSRMPINPGTAHIVPYNYDLKLQETEIEIKDDALFINITGNNYYRTGEKIDRLTSDLLKIAERVANGLPNIKNVKIDCKNVNFINGLLVKTLGALNLILKTRSGIVTLANVKPQLSNVLTIMHFDELFNVELA